MDHRFRLVEVVAKNAHGYIYQGHTMLIKRWHMHPSELPGYGKVTLALFPFRRYETGRWIIRALKHVPPFDVT